MAAPSMSPVSPQSRDLDPATLRRQGMLAGLLGAAVLAAWFLILDVLRGHPLATPTFLAHVMLAGGVAREALRAVEPSLGQTLVFTAVHALTFVVIGVVVAELLRVLDLVHSKAITLALLLGALCIAFVAFGIVFTAVGPDGISLRDAFIGNLLAAFSMAGYLAFALAAVPRT